MERGRPPSHLAAATHELTLHANRRILAGMTEGTRHRWLAGITTACVAALAIGCSNYQPNKITFRFTPIPVITPGELLGTPVSIDPNTCSVFVADEVLVTLDAKERKSFELWLDGVGFVVRKADSPSYNPELVYYIVQVPLGSVPDAIALLAKQRGVQHAATNNFDIRLAAQPQPPSAGEYLGCKTPVQQ